MTEAWTVEQDDLNELCLNGNLTNDDDSLQAKWP